MLLLVMSKMSNVALSKSVGRFNKIYANLKAAVRNTNDGKSMHILHDVYNNDVTQIKYAYMT